ncbi:tRNA-dependent cyclodipeptide synthase [Nonomuraea longicatena]
MTTVEAVPLTPRCARIYAAREHALLGIGASDGYFSLPVITGLLRWGLRHFARVDVLVPGMELAGTLAVRGDRKALRRARAAIDNTRDRVAAALETLGRPEVGVFSWTDLVARSAYSGLRHEIDRLYVEDPDFREHCAAALEPVLHLPRPDPSRIREAVPSLLSELPLMLDTPSIVGTGSSVFCYPRMLPVARRLYAGLLPIHPSPSQGMVTTRLTAAYAGAAHWHRGDGNGSSCA